MVRGTVAHVLCNVIALFDILLTYLDERRNTFTYLLEKYKFVILCRYHFEILAVDCLVSFGTLLQVCLNNISLLKCTILQYITQKGINSAFGRRVATSGDSSPPRQDPHWTA